MNKLTKSIFVLFTAIGLTLSGNAISANASPKNSGDDIYNNYNNFDLQNYSVESTNSNNISITKIDNKNNLKSSLFIKLPEDTKKEKLNSIIKQNPAVKQAISKQLKKGNKIIGLSVTERYLEESIDKKTGETKYRFLTNSEVKAYTTPKKYTCFASVNSGVEQRKGKLTLTSLLVSPKLTGQANVYNLVGNANWDVSGFNSDQYKSPAVGEDLMCLAWPTKYRWSDGNFKGFYNNGSSINASIKEISNSNGVVWQFQDKYPTNSTYIGARNISSFAKLKKVGSTSGPQLFTVQYVHTYSKLVPSYSLGMSSSGSSVGLNITNEEKSWHVTSPITIE